MKALFDADTILYTAAIRGEAEAVSYFGEEAQPDVGKALRGLKGYIDYLCNGALADYEPVFIVSDPDANFRCSVYEDYKSNRSDSNKPRLLSVVRRWFLKHYDVQWEPTLEADDIVAIHASHEPCVVVGIDKDFDQLPNTPRYNQRRSEWIPPVGEHEALRELFVQALKGDRIDGYPGAHRVGDKTARKILSEADDTLDPFDYEQELWRLTRDAYLKREYTEDYALQMLRCARLLRHGEYDFETKEITLWSPTLKL